MAEVQVLETRSLLSSGTLNASFGAAGVQLVAAGTAEAGESARAMAITADGKIVIAGSATGGATGSDFALTELNADGSVNASFGAGGHVTLDVSGAQNDVINSVAIDASGRIVVAGTTSGPTGAHDAVVMRFNANGSVDTSFGAGGKVIFDFTGDVTQSSIANGVTINANAQIIVAGTAMIGSGAGAHTEFGIARFNADGSVDGSFGASGQTIVDVSGLGASANAVTLDAAGNIDVVGSAMIGSFNQLAAVRLTAGGALDGSFGSGGIETVNLGNDAVATQVAINASGSIYLAGNLTVNGQSSIVLTRLNPNGVVDGSFGVGGTATTSFNSGGSETARGIAIDSSGNIYVAASLNTGVAGQSDIGVARFRTDGTLESSFGTNGKVLEKLSTGLDSVAGVMLDANGNLVVGGSSTGDVSLPLGINFGALQLQANASRTTSTFRPLNLTYTGTLSGTAGAAGSFSGPVSGSGTVNFTSATQGSAASITGSGTVGPVTFTGLTNVTVNNGQIQATVNGTVAGAGSFAAAATGTLNVSTSPFPVTLTFNDAATGVSGNFTGTIADTTGVSASVAPTSVTFSATNGLNATIGVSGDLLTAANMSAQAATVSVFWATGTTLATKIGTASIVDSATIPINFNTGTVNFQISTDALGAIPAGATNILVVTNLNGNMTTASAPVTLSIPNLAGEWFINGQPTFIAQAGSSLIFTNERGLVASGTVTSSNTVQATGWDNLNGTLTLNDDNLAWANGSVWTRADASPANIAGTWVINGKQTTIIQAGANLTFINEFGAASAGQFVGPDQIEATGWGNLRATLVNGNTQINWGNGTTWVQAPTAAVNIAGTWMINGQSTNIVQAGTNLTFTNEHGMVSAGFFSATNQVTASTWLNLVGTLSADGSIIHWANGSEWTKFVSNPPTIAGGWHIGTGLATQIAQSGSVLTFTNEHGNVSSGEFISATQVDANAWGDLVGVLSNNNSRIDWSNGTFWTAP